MSRAPRTLEAVLPVAAAEPDGLLVTTSGEYVRLLGCGSLLQPQAGGRAHREQIRERLGALAARIPAGHGLQILVEAEPLDPDQALAPDWREINAAATAAEARGERELGGAMRRLGYGLEQTIRRSAPAIDATRLQWTVATRWRPSADGSSISTYQLPADWSARATAAASATPGRSSEIHNGRAVSSPIAARKTTGSRRAQPRERPAALPQVLRRGQN